MDSFGYCNFACIYIVQLLICIYGKQFDGSMNAREREDRLNIFRSDPRVTVILVSLKCGSLGLNLTCANRVCLMDVVSFWYYSSV